MQYKPHHTAISVRNLGLSLAFYEALGFRQVHRYDEQDGSMAIVELALGATVLEIFAYAKNNHLPMAKYGYANDVEEVGVKHIGLRTDDITAALRDLWDKGLADSTTTIEASETNKAWWFFIKDPDGMWVEVIQEERY